MSHWEEKSANEAICFEGVKFKSIRVSSSKLCPVCDREIMDADLNSVPEAEELMLDCSQCGFAAMIDRNKLYNFNCVAFVDKLKVQIPSNLLPDHLKSESSVKIFLLTKTFNIKLNGRQVIELKQA